MLFRKQRNQQSMPPWMKWAVLAFLGLAFLGNLHNSKNPNAPSIPQVLSTAAGNLTPKKFLPLDSYKNILSPPVPPETVEETETLKSIRDTASGEGAPAVCGQQVKLAYTTYDQHNKPVNMGETLSFRIGDDKEMPILEESIVGMKKGGKRTIISSSRRFEAELLSMAPPIPDLDATPYRIATVAPGIGLPAVLCGKPGKFKITLWGMDGKKLYSGDKPISFTPGKSEVFLGLEQGVIGMKQGEMRTLVVPPDFQKTMDGNPPAVDFPLPKDQTVLVDVEAVP